MHLRFEMDERIPRGCGASREDGQMLGTPSSSAKLRVLWQSASRAQDQIMRSGLSPEQRWH